MLLLCLAIGTLASELDPQKRYTIIGNYIPIQEDSRVASSDQQFEGDLSSATIVVSREFIDDDGESVFVEFSRGTISNGRVILEGEIGEPMLAKISVEGVFSRTLSALTMLAPQQVVSFTLLDHQAPHAEDWLLLAGTLKLAKNPAKRFTIVGNLAGVDEARNPMPMVTVYGKKFDAEGKRRTSFYGAVLAENNNFLIEGEIDEPRVVQISVSSNEGIVWADTKAIIEPNAVISVVVSSPWAQKLAVTAGSGKHAEIVGTWRMSEEYLATEKALDERFKKVRTRSAIQHREDLNGQASGLEEEVEAAAAKPAFASASQIAPALDCEHILPSEDSISKDKEIAPTKKKSTATLLNEKLFQIRNTKLQEIAMNAKDPFNSLLALELDPFIVLGDHSPSSAALPIYDNLTMLLDEEFVARRVKPARDALAQSVARDANNRKLVAGQKAPSFELPTLSGNEIELSKVLAQAEYVYIDFWASWCGPCIEDFPALKDLYGVYGGDELEILTISVDDTYDAWRDAAETIEFPWIDLGSLGGILTPTPVSYGILHLPAGMLVDTKGCIVQTDIRPAELKKLLAANYGEPPLDE